MTTPDTIVPMLPHELAAYQAGTVASIEYYEVTYPYPGCARFDTAFGAVVIDIAKGLACVFKTDKPGVYQSILRKRIAADDYLQRSFAPECAHEH